MSIDPNIKKKADDIRTRIEGVEVRESLASGLEEMSSDVVENEGRQSVVESRQDSVESQWQAVSDEMTGKDVISAPEIIAARDGEANLKARLDKNHNEVTAQLAQKTDKTFVDSEIERLDQKDVDLTAQLAQTLSSVNIKSFGAVGDNVTDDTQAIKEAISYIGTTYPRPSLYIPEGTYLISEPLDIDLAYGKIFGSAMGQSIIKAMVPMEKMINFTFERRVNEFILLDFQLDGNNLADIGIYIPRVDHSYFTQLRIMNTLTDGIVFSGWCNTFTGNRIHANDGNGIRTINSAGNEKENNALNIFQNKIYNNGGIGIVLQNGALINVDGNTIERNKKTGIYVVGGIDTLNIKNNYFEANALDDGLNMMVDTKEENYKTDVFINGRLDENIFSFGSQDMNYNVSAIGNYHSVHRRFCYYLNAVDTITIENNETNIASRLIGYIENIALSKVVNLVVGKNYLRPVVLDQPDESLYYTNYEFLPVLKAGQSHDMHTWELLNSNSFSTFDLLPDGIPSKFGMSTTDNVEVINDRFYMGKRLFKLIKPDPGDSNGYGYGIDLDKHPEMRGAYIYVTVSFFTGQTNVVPSIRVRDPYNTSWLATNDKIEPNKWKTLSYGMRLGNTGKVFVGGGVKQSDGDSEIIMTYPTITVFNNIVHAVIQS